MIRSTFGKTGLEVSPLGYGSAESGLLKTDEPNLATIVNLLLDSGVNLIDTAASYADAEEMLGRVIMHRRKEFVLVSKCGQKFPDVPGEAWSKQAIAGTVDRSLRRLKTDHIDVMLLHSCDIEILKRGEALGALVEARQAGKIRNAGYSGDNEAAAYAVTLPDIAVVQTSISIADQVNIDGALPGARQHKVGVMAKRPIANACWKPLSEQPGFYSTYVADYHNRLKSMGLVPADLGFAGDERKAWAEIALRFTLSQPGMSVAIIGTLRADNARANVAAASKGPLAGDVVAKIRAAFKAAIAQANVPWPGLT